MMLEAKQWNITTFTQEKIKWEHGPISRIKDAIQNHCNPFAVDGNMIYNIITHAYIQDEYVPQILNIHDMGPKLYEDLMAERTNGDVNLWPL